MLYSNGEILAYGIDNGRSTTWGAFGGESMKLQGYLHISTYLNLYRPEVSVNNSWITYGSNRVDLLMLREVRYYGPNGLLHRDTSPRIVYQADSQ